MIAVHSPQVTSNARNEAMFREATIFAGHLQVVEKELTQWQRDIDSSFTNFRTIMLSPLPRVYEEGHNGMAVPSEPEPTMVGGDVQVERLTTAAQETRKRLDVEVIQPIKQWMVAYRTIAERMRRLEALRLELDSRRRTVADLQGESLSLPSAPSCSSWQAVSCPVAAAISRMLTCAPDCLGQHMHPAQFCIVLSWQQQQCTAHKLACCCPALCWCPACGGHS